MKKDKQKITLQGIWQSFKTPLKETALREKTKKGSKGIWGAICLSLILLVTLYAGLYDDLFCGGHHRSECIGIPYFMHGIISFTFSLAYIGDMFLFVFESFTSPSPDARLVTENALFFFALLGFQFFLILRPAFRFSRKAICILYFKRLDSSQAEKKVLLFVLFLIFLPTICATAVKWQYIPFRYSPQLVTVDMRYAELKIPRHYLTSWTLFPAKDGDFLPFMGIRARGEAGFARFWVSLNDIDPQIHSNEKIEIYVSAKRTSEIASNGNKFRLSYDLDADIQRQHADIDLKITNFVESFIVEKE